MSIKQIIDKIEIDGYIGLSNFILEKYGEKEDESICWNCVKYLFSLFGISYSCKEDGRPIELSQGNELTKNPNELDLWSDGLYFCYQVSKAECHYFTLYVQNESLTLIQTTQGIHELTVKTFSKEIWIKNYKKMARGNRNCYRLIFDLPDYYMIESEDYTPQKLKYIVAPLF